MALIGLWEIKKSGKHIDSDNPSDDMHNKKSSMQTMDKRRDSSIIHDANLPQMSCFQVWHGQFPYVFVFDKLSITASTTDDEAAASKRTEVLGTFSLRSNEYLLSFLIEQTFRNTVFFLLWRWHTDEIADHV